MFWIIQYMSITSRMCGSTSRIPWGMEQWLYAIPYLVVTFIMLLPTSGTVFHPYPYHIFALSILAYLAAVLGKRLPHGQYFDLGGWKGTVRKAKYVDPVVSLLFGPDIKPNYWRDAFGLAITGLACSLVAGIVVITVNPIQGAILAISGASKAPAYMLAKFLKCPPAAGEYLTGLFAGLFIYLVLNL